MSFRLPNGAVLSIASAYLASKQMTAVTNANPGVATLEASSGVSAGDIIEITSGWPKLNGLIVKAGTPSSNDIPLTGIDTSSTTFFPAGAGTGSVREVSTWQTITQVIQLQTQGGQQQFATASFLDSDDQFQVPTSRAPQSLTIDIADDISLPHYAVLDAADQDRQPRALRLQLPGSSVIYYNGIVALNRTPSTTKDQVMTLSATFSLQARATRY